MEIKRIPMDDPVILGTAPTLAFYNGNEKTGENLAFGGFLEKELVGYVLMELEADSKFVKLKYLYTVPECRRMGIARELIGHCAAAFEKKHMEGIGCRALFSPEDMETADEVLVRCGFLPVSLSDRFFVYGAEDILEAKEEYGHSLTGNAEPFLFKVHRKSVYVFVDEEKETETDRFLGRLFLTIDRAEETVGEDFSLVIHFTKPETFQRLAEIFGEPEEHFLVHDFGLYFGEE